MVNKKTIAVIVTYNRKNILIECINSLLNQTISESLDILIIDNASTDGTYEAIQGYIESYKVQYKNTGSNLGGAGGFEYGVIEASKREYDYLWIMDDDTIPTETALEEFYKYIYGKNDFGFLASYVQWVDGNACKMNVPRKNIFQKINRFDNEVIPIQYATFVSVLIPRNVIFELGAPIGEFFIWGDDWEYTRRISKRYSSYLVMNSVVIHKTLHNNGCNISNDVDERLPRYELYFRNNLYVAKKEGVLGIVYWCANVLKNIMLVLLKGKDNKLKRIKIIFKGIVKGFNFSPRIKKVNES